MTLNNREQVNTLANKYRRKIW